MIIINNNIDNDNNKSNIIHVVTTYNDTANQNITKKHNK